VRGSTFVLSQPRTLMGFLLGVVRPPSDIVAAHILFPPFAAFIAASAVLGDPGNHVDFAQRARTMCSS